MHKKTVATNSEKLVKFVKNQIGNNPETVSLITYHHRV